MYKKLTKALLLSLSISLLTIDETFGKKNPQNKVELKRVLPFLQPISVIHQFRNDDLYWIKWLQENSFDLNKTTNHFYTNLQWHQREKIDTIHLEDWTYFENEYPAFHDTVDKIGRPIIETWLSDWNIRQAVISGKRRQFIRWYIYTVEMAMRNLFISRLERNSSATGIIQIVDHAGVNLLTQGCPSCVSVFDAIQSTVPQHYPGIIQEVILVNVGSAHSVLLTMWKKTFSTPFNMSLYGRQLEWSPVLNNKVCKNQLSIRFGGTKIRDEKQ